MENEAQNKLMDPQSNTTSLTGEKLQEYEKMFKILYKQADYDKVKSLALELKQLDPGNKLADKWNEKAEKKTSKKGFFTSLFSRSKKSEANTANQNIVDIEQKSEEIKPVTPQQQALSQPLTQPTSQLANPKLTVSAPPAPVVTLSANPPQSQISVTQPIITPTEIKKEEKPQGNTFTKMFGGPSSSKDKASIIDRIVAKTEKKEKPAPSVKSPTSLYQAAKPKKEFNLLSFAKVFMNFTAGFIFLTGTFLYVDFLDQENRFLGLVGIEDNTGSKLHAASEELTKTKRQVAVLEQEIQKFKVGYQDNALNQVKVIIEERINWPDILFKINEVTNSVYELNDFFKYVEYENYAFDAETQTIRITGHLTDPQGRNLTKLVELEDAFKYYPKDKSNPDDPTQPFFQGFKELTSLSKTIDKETGRYVSDFQLSFNLNPEIPMTDSE